MDQYNNLSKERDELQKHYQEDLKFIEQKMAAITKQMKNGNKEKEIQRIERAAVDMRKIPSPSTISCSQLEYVAYKFYGYGNYPSRFYTVAEVDKIYTDDEYKKILQIFIETSYCHYCLSRTHLITECNFYQNHICSWCGYHSHTEDGCRKPLS